MKKTLIMILVMLGCVTVSAQKINKNELKQIQVFLSEISETGISNAAVLEISNAADPATWKGVLIDNGHVTEINWSRKKLAGTLDLSNFSALTKVDISSIDSWLGIKFSNYYSNPLPYAEHLYLNGEEVKDLVIPGSCTSIGDFALTGCRGLKSVAIPNSVTII